MTNNGMSINSITNKNHRICARICCFKPYGFVLLFYSAYFTKLFLPNTYFFLLVSFMDTEIIKIILAFIVLINPFSALTIFVDLTRDYDLTARRHVAQIAALTVFVTISFFTIAGESMLKILGISVGSFQVAGGILVFLIALNMMNGEGNPVKPNEENLDLNHVQEVVPSAASAVVPLAIPMLIGPGGISTVIIYSSQVSGIWQTGSIIVAGLFISVFCYLSLMAAGRVSHFLGDTGLNIVSRIMGMLLAAVAVEILVNGLRTIFPQLG